MVSYVIKKVDPNAPPKKKVLAKPQILQGRDMAEVTPRRAFRRDARIFPTAAGKAVLYNHPLSSTARLMQMKMTDPYARRNLEVPQGLSDSSYSSSKANGWTGH